MMALKYMTDEDVVVFNGMKEVVSDVHLGSTMEALIYATIYLITDLPTHSLCCFVVFGSDDLYLLLLEYMTFGFEQYATRFTVYIFDANNKKFTFCLPFENKYDTSQMSDGLYLQFMYLQVMSLQVYFSCMYISISIPHIFLHFLNLSERDRNFTHNFNLGF
ncbi:hypothetical protein ACJX0J_038202 [Zea mays]